MDKFIFIEADGLLYRGFAPNHPVDIWDYPRRRWVPFKQAGEQKQGWGKQINRSKAAKLKTDNPYAEHFKYYDTPPWSQPLSDAYRERTVPDNIKERRAARGHLPSRSR